MFEAALVQRNFRTMPGPQIDYFQLGGSIEPFPRWLQSIARHCVNVLDHSSTMIIFLEGKVNINLWMLLHVDLNVRKYFGTMNFIFNKFNAGHAKSSPGLFITYLFFTWNPHRNFMLCLRSCTSLTECFEIPGHVPGTKVASKASPLQVFDSNSPWPTFGNSLFWLCAAFLLHVAPVFTFVAFTAVLVPFPELCP